MLPAIVDFRSNDAPVFTQGDMGCCCSAAIAMSWYCRLLRLGRPCFRPSILFLHYNAVMARSRIIKDFDIGSSMRCVMKMIERHGMCPEELWPSVPSNLGKTPQKDCFDEAAKHKTVSYGRVAKNVDAMEEALAANQPIVLGIDVYESLKSEEVAASGVMPMPDTRKEKKLSKHSVRVAGYNRRDRQFIVANSWGEAWGQKGYFLMPYAAAIEYGGGYWTIKDAS